MALRTAQQYLSSLHDDRVLYCAGERVTDAQGLHAVLEAALARKGCSLVEVVIG